MEPKKFNIRRQRGKFSNVATGAGDRTLIFLAFDTLPQISL
jgi:hypothetical protein